MKRYHFLIIIYLYGIELMAQSQSEQHSKIIVTAYSRVPVEEKLLSTIRSIIVGNIASVHPDRIVVPEKDPLVIEKLLSCMDPTCISEIGQNLNLDYIIIAELQPQATNFILYLIATDVKNRSYIATAMINLPSDLSQWKQILSQKALAIANSIPPLNPKTGSLVVLTDPSDIKGILYINDKKVAELPTAPIKGLPPGKIKVKIVAIGYKPYEKEVEISAGEETILEALLVKETKSAKKREKKWYKNKWVWIGVGAGVVALGTGITLGLVLTQEEHKTEWGIPFPDYR